MEVRLGIIYLFTTQLTNCNSWDFFWIFTEILIVNKFFSSSVEFDIDFEVKFESIEVA